MHEMAWEVFIGNVVARPAFDEPGEPGTHSCQSFPPTPYSRATFYGGDVAEYTDYPEYGELERA